MGQPDHMAGLEGIQTTVDLPVEEAIGGTGGSNLNLGANSGNLFLRAYSRRIK